MDVLGAILGVWEAIWGAILEAILEVLGAIQEVILEVLRVVLGAISEVLEAMFVWFTSLWMHTNFTDYENGLGTRSAPAKTQC